MRAKSRPVAVPRPRDPIMAVVPQIRVFSVAATVPLGSWLCPAEKIAPERFAPPVLNVQSPPLSSVQRYGDCGLWWCCAIRFGDISSVE